MMRGRYNWAVAVRTPDGSIYTEEHDLASGRKKNAWMYWPVIRGCTAFVESLALGYKALGISGEHAYEWDEEESDDANELDADKKSGGTGALMTISMIVGIVLGIVIFVVLPAALGNLVLGEESMNSVAWNIFDGIVRVAIFIVYIWLISLMKDIRRMFSYHGAEHKTIHCYEHGEVLDPGIAMRFPRFARALRHCLHHHGHAHRHLRLHGAGAAHQRALSISRALPTGRCASCSSWSRASSCCPSSPAFLRGHRQMGWFASG